MFGSIKKVMILVMSAISTVSPNCLLLKNQECKVRKVIIDNDYMTFPYKILIENVLEVVMMYKNLILKLVYPILLKISVQSFLTCYQEKVS